MIEKVLIANRGEIAVRIIRACKELGIATVAVFSEIDRESLHVKLADESVCIGPNSPLDSYLNIINIISAAIAKKADAIHPGFGFLSENYEFAEMCEEVKIKFIGPDSKTIFQLGNKSRAKEIMQTYGVPVIPGSKSAFKEVSEAYEEALNIGFPLLVKAVSGGGGRGIRLIEKKENFNTAFNQASHEAKIAFNDPALYIEKFLKHPKHIEFQILADNYGNCIHLGERDCSLQRRKQKVIEETPSVVISSTQREEMGEKITKALKAIGYKNAGTVEFLYEDNKFFFMEMNTRIQVEHSITELVTGVDILKEQLKIASGEKISISQNDIKITNHAIECRINAEDIYNNFMPFSGKIEELRLPGGLGVRIDSGIYQGCTISPFYDSMILKLIVTDKTREEAIAKMLRALDELEITGVKHNKIFHQKLLHANKVLKGNYSINFIEDEFLTEFRKQVKQ